MKFVCFIASTMLIVLINQHSTMGLPVSDTSAEKQCPEGMELNKNGICKKVLPPKAVTARTIVTKEDPKEPERKDGACPEGMVHGKHGICQEVQLTETTTISEALERTAPTIVAKKDPERKYGSCPEGMVHGKHGICQDVQLTETTTVGKETELTETTTARKVDSEPKVNLNGCPKGTKKDDQGACQEIEPTNNKKVTTDPKTFLEKDGSCPENFKMVNGKCLFVKPKPKLPSYPVLLNSAKPKSGNAETFEYEKVPMRPDGSCPEGTEYSEYRLCQKRISNSKSKFDIKADGKCPADFELIDGKCTPKTSSKEQDQSSEASTTNALPLSSESTTVAAEPKVNRKSKVETATVKESSAELLLTTTSQPL